MTNDSTAAASTSSAEDAPSEESGDLAALYASVNDLPADDPLRQKNDAVSTPAVIAAPLLVSSRKGVFAALPDKLLMAFREHGGSNWVADETATMQPLHAPVLGDRVQADGSVIVDPGRKVAVPVLDGGLRAVIRKAAMAGLRVQPVGSGTAQEQVPAAGTPVPIGTEVVVRFAR